MIIHKLKERNKDLFTVFCIKGEHFNTKNPHKSLWK